MAEAGGLSEKYEYITSLAYRQAISAHKLIEDNEGNIIFLSKENDSNGCIGTVLAFGQAGSWSMKYNMVWDNLLGYCLFSDEAKKNEIEVYKGKMNRYGVPLDSRATFTKIDWLMWSTCIWEDFEYFDQVCQAITNMINETADRVPMTDWYDIISADYKSFINRSVVGGLFIKLL